jgi:CheY-like chemotaxis protein
MSANEKANILIVDDLPEKLLVLGSILEELGQNVVPARSGPEALRRVLEQDFAVILLDVHMPGMDGYETAALVRGRKRSAHVPIIFITAFADELNMAQGYSLGAVDYILSPVVPEVLRTKVRVFVELYLVTQRVRRQAEEAGAKAAAEEAQRRSAFLAEASRVLVNSLDFEETLDALLRFVVPPLADFAAITLADEHSRLQRTAAAWHDGGVTRQDWDGGLAGDLSVPLQKAMLDKKVVFVGNGGEAGPAPFAVGPVMFLPLLARGRVPGRWRWGWGRPGGTTPWPTRRWRRTWPAGPRWRWTTAGCTARCRTPTAARTSSCRCWPTSCATPWPPSATASSSSRRWGWPTPRCARSAT